MNQLRVLQMGSPTGMYGAERWIMALVRHLDPARIESRVGVILDDLSQPAPLVQAAAAAGFGTHVVPAPGRINWAAVRGLRDVIVRERIDVLHTHFYKTDLIGLLAVRGTGCRIVTTPHGWSTDAGLALRAYEALDRAIFPFFDAVVPLSQDLHDGLRRLPGIRLHLIRNGVDLGEVEQTVDLAPEAREWRAAGDFVVGYVGQLIARKGLDVLFRAFAAAEVPNKRLVLVGQGDQRAELEALAATLGIADRTHFLGFRDDRIAVMRGFDVFALPSRLEGIPRCLMESMAAGVPIVASDIPGCRDLVEHDRTGLLFRLDDVDALRTQLELLRDGERRARYAAAAHTLVNERYSARAMAEAYEQLFIELASGTPAHATRAAR
jgi:glycosyltransferase involved in cell wall biosynthesis